MASKQALVINPGKGLGFLFLGVSLKDVLTRLRAQPEIFPKLKVQFSGKAPLTESVNIELPRNGLRLRFDGPDQRLRLIEVIDFTKVALTYKGQDLVKSQEGEPTSGPSFRHVYSKLFGPTFEGEHFSPSNGSSQGLYVLSYPGVAFSFSVINWPDNSDFVSVLSSPSASPAVAMSIFNGSSWKDARKDLYTRPCPHPRAMALVGRPKDSMPDEVELAIIKGLGRIEFKRRTLPPFTLVLGQATPQDLVLTLGPPDAIYRKNDRRISIHKDSSAGGKAAVLGSSPQDQYLVSDTDRSSISTATSYSGPEDELANTSDSSTTECFYNYFSHGFDILMSQQLNISPPLCPPLHAEEEGEAAQVQESSTTLVATKILLHGNIPGSHSFNRYRRSRWILDSSELSPNTAITQIISSETPFSSIRSTLNRIWGPTLTSDMNSTSSRISQRYMVLNRNWGDSPGSSIELLGGWEDADVDADVEAAGVKIDDEKRNNKTGGNTELYGWPGLLFEVLRNDAVACVTIY